jgi:hypothetical protein
MTVTLLSGATPDFPAGSTFVELVAIAQLSSGAIHTAIGGPTTLPGTSMVAFMVGG